MAAIIDTSHRYVGLWGVDAYGVSMDGFTAGNFAGGVLPTQLSSDWCNAVQQEINNAAIQYLPFALGSTTLLSGPADLAYAIDYSHVNRKPIFNSSNTPFTFRSQADSLLTANGKLCVASERTLNTFSIAAGAAANVGIMAIPTNTQCLLEFRATLTQTDAPTTNYSHVYYIVSVRNSAGVVTIQNSVALYSWIPGIVYVWAISTSGANATLRVTVPAAPAGKVHNCETYMRMLTVTTGV
jgi:hypothetical protein